ncbi:hypothetical protein PV08_05237 [Exophiala spinifera]|uniref:Uncharacterized protein n=1 Tax=Exophiala spinifera TaxID=91928 RepID=A0A0D1ZQW0_9EURO|nr:uncharacterized protein PV08_05237 [Exophiala spinifera]KIW15192.1 hypothetical protein PV08_05237 [Exophiala spinifera]
MGPMAVLLWPSSKLPTTTRRGMKRALSADHDAQFTTFILIAGYRRTGGRSYAALPRTATSLRKSLPFGGPLTVPTFEAYKFWGLLPADVGDRNLKRWCRVPLPPTLHQSRASGMRLVQYKALCDEECPIVCICGDLARSTGDLPLRAALLYLVTDSRDSRIPRVVEWKASRYPNFITWRSA